MTSSSLRADDAAAQWQVALQEGHISLKVAERLISRSWIAPCPLPVDTAEPVPDDSEHFMDLIVVALHWAGPPTSPPTSAVIAIPEAASHGVQGSQPMQVECYYSDGQSVDTAEVVLVLASADYLARVLRDATSASAEVTSFVPDVVGAAPLASSLFTMLSMPEALLQGFWVHGDENGGVRCMVSGAVADEIFVSAAEDDLPSSPMRAVVDQPCRARRPSVLALGTNVKALAAMLSPPKVPGQGAPQTTSKAKPPSKAVEKETLAQLVSAVTALGDRMASLETQQRQLTSRPQAPPAHSPAAGGTAPAGHPQPSVAAIAAAPGFLPQSTGLTPKAPSIIGHPPTGPPGVASYEHSLSEARRLLALGAPPPATVREDALPGRDGGRERAVDAELRAAVLRGGPDSQTALNIALLDTLERIGNRESKKSSDEELFDSFLAGDLVDNGSGKVELARGAHGLLRLSQAIERAPAKWYQQCNMAAQRALGSDPQMP
eukprot:2728741-Amphidinium_carterae.1